MKVPAVAPTILKIVFNLGNTIAITIIKIYNATVIISNPFSLIKFLLLSFFFFYIHIFHTKYK